MMKIFIDCASGWDTFINVSSNHSFIHMNKITSPIVNWEIAENLPQFGVLENPLIEAQRASSIAEATAQLIAALGEPLGSLAATALEEPSEAIIASRLAFKAAGEAVLAAATAAETAVESAVEAFKGLTAQQRATLIARVGGETTTGTVGSWGLTLEGGVIRQPNEPPSVAVSSWVFESVDGGHDMAVEGWIPAREITADDIAAAAADLLLS
jgi:hypothetical protein